MRTLIIASSLVLFASFGCKSSDSKNKSDGGGDTSEAGSGGMHNGHAGSSGTGSGGNGGTGGKGGALKDGQVADIDGATTGDDSGTNPTDSGVDSGNNNGNTDSGMMDSGSQPVKHTLTFDNYLAWCDIMVNGGTATTHPAAMQFDEGTVVNLHAAPNGSFVWGYWMNTDGDTSGSHDQNQTTTVTMSADKKVNVCCPTNGGTCTFSGG